MMKKLSWVLVIFVCSFLFFTSPSFALNAQNQRVYLPGGRTFSLMESKVKPKDTLSLGFGFNYAMQPIEFGNSATGTRIQGIVDHLFTFDFGVGYSITDRFAIGMNLPMHVTNNIISTTNLAQETVFSLGDISFAAEYTILDRDASSAGFGFSVVPFLTLPTGESSNFIGDSSATGGFLAVGDVDLNGHYVGVNLGFRFRKQEDFLNLSIAQEMVYGVGYHHYISESYDIDGFAQVDGSMVLNGVTSNSSPFEVKLGVSKTISEETPLTIKVGPGFGFGNGYGSPDFRAIAQVSYDYLIVRKEKPEPIVEVPEPVRIEKVEKRLKELTIYYPTDGAQVDPFYDEKISGIADVLKENPDLAPLYIIGHTDDVASDGYNQKLSERRSKQAYESILQHGVDPKQIVYMGVGETDHVVPNDSDTNRALNRRTVFTFAKPHQLIENGAKYHGGGSRSVKMDGKKNDSYTEVLKSNPTYTPNVVEETQTKTIIVRPQVGEETDTSYTTPEPVKAKKTKVKKDKKKKKKDTLNETSLDTSENTYEDFKD